MPAEPIASYVITKHAREEMARRGLAENIVRAVLRAPGERQAVRSSKVAKYWQGA